MPFRYPLGKEDTDRVTRKQNTTEHAVRKVRSIPSGLLTVELWEESRVMDIELSETLSESQIRNPTFGITDSNTSPIARYCDAHVIAPVVGPSFLNSYVAPMAVIGAIHVACAHIDSKRALKRMRPTDEEYASGLRWYREPKGFNGDLP